ncbi:ABC transporter ATP-binding protein [Pseudonocardia xishanensis]|uniref:ABC transporter ATP-binding protein n=1 Tax=Pseudonocardia xishanensis TaxID=630995 RepID=A0ABP8RZR1_9PSEU
MTDLLSVTDLAVGYGETMALFDVEFSVGAGEVVTLLGPNGAGKTTTLLTVMGFLEPRRGSVRAEGRDLKGVSPHRRARDGWTYVPDDRALLANLTVAENLSIVRNAKADPFELFPELEALRGRRAGLLSGGEQQMLALARALCTRPKLLLVDELSLGLAPLVVGRLLTALREAADTLGSGVLLVEQQVERVLEVADLGHVLVRGRIEMSGSAAELRANRSVVEASYLGERAADPEATAPAVEPRPGALPGVGDHAQPETPQLPNR